MDRGISTLALALIALGVLFFCANLFGLWWSIGWFDWNVSLLSGGLAAVVWPLVLVGLGAAVLLGLRSRRAE